MGLILPAAAPVVSGAVTSAWILFCVALGLVFSYFTFKKISAIEVDPDKMEASGAGLLVQEDGLPGRRVQDKVFEIYRAIYDGAHSFLYQSYVYQGVFMILFSVIIVIVLGTANKEDGRWVDAAFSCVAFLVGATTSILAGFIGMKVGVFSNARTAMESQRSIGLGFKVAFRGGIVMGFVLLSMGLLNLFLIIHLFRAYYQGAFEGHEQSDWDIRHRLFEVVAAYGLGGSSIALFGRVGGGIYTKAADVGADLVGKIEVGIPEDDPRNPAVIADNVGDNVGDIAGMGADLFGSFAESTCAALVIGSNSDMNQEAALMFPLLITATGLIVCFLTSFFATHFGTVRSDQDVEPSLKRQLIVSTVLMTPAIFCVTQLFLPESITLYDGLTIVNANVKNWHVGLCVMTGLWSGLIIGFVTEYYTSARFRPTQEVSESSDTGAATVIIYGLALGYKSVIVPVFCLAVTIYINLYLAGFYGVACGALGILSTMATGLAIDGFGPITDNAGGIAEMAELGQEVRDRTDALDAAGNTTAAIGKGFAIGSAALVSLALFGGFATNTGILHEGIDILKPFPFAGLLIGAMLPYWFSAMTLKSVGKAALAMVEEVRDQFRRNPGIMQGTVKPDYARCIKISTDASLREMIPPGVLVMGTPLIVGFLFGTQCLAGLLAGALVSGVQMAISMSNTGGSWDNAKKFCEAGMLGEGKLKGSNNHKATVVGDTVGDPLKDTSGPSLNILMKLMAILSLVFSHAFPTNEGGLIGKIFA